MPADRDERTEPPTARRRREARTGGQVARSQDLTAAVLLLAAFVALALTGPKLWLTLIAVVRSSLSPDAPGSLTETLPFSAAVCIEVFKRVAPYLLVIFLAILAALYAQVGVLFTFKPLMPSFSKINPLNGLKRLFSMRSVMMALINVGKLAVVGLVAFRGCVPARRAYDVRFEHEARGRSDGSGSSGPRMAAISPPTGSPDDQGGGQRRIPEHGGRSADQAAAAGGSTAARLTAAR